MAMFRTPLLLLLAALTAALPAQDATDTIQKQDGSSVRGVTVTSFGLATIKFQRSKDEVELPAHQVKDIQWGRVPDSFAGGLGAMARGDFDAAQKLFGEAATASDRDVVKQESRLLQAKALAMAGAADAAAAANAANSLSAWIGEFPEHFRLPEAMLLLGRARRLGGMQAEAETALKELDDRAGRDGWGAEWSAQAKFELALCLLAQNKALDARGAFQSAGNAAETAQAAAGGNSPAMAAIRINAKVGEGESLVAESQFDRAADYFRTLAQNDDASLAAAGKAGQGEATFLGAVASGNDAATLRAAEIALAEACVLDTGKGETAAKACYYLGRVVLALGERAGQDFKARANAYFQIVVKSYPSSRWAGPAKSELAK